MMNGKWRSINPVKNFGVNRIPIFERFCYKFEQFLLEEPDGTTYACDECKIPEFITKTWYKDCM